MDKYRMPISRANLDALLDDAFTPPHMIPVFRAIRDNRLRLMIVQQQTGSFIQPMLEIDGPFVTIIADDTDRAVGPDFFHKRSLRRLAETINGAAVIAGTPPPEAYSTMTMMPTLYGHSTAIIETRPEQEIQWVNYLRSVNPELPLIFSTVKEGAA